MHITLLALLSAVSLTIAACGEPSGPFPSGDTFVLRTIAGEPLPTHLPTGSRHPHGDAMVVTLLDFVT